MLTSLGISHRTILETGNQSIAVVGIRAVFASQIDPHIHCFQTKPISKPSGLYTSHTDLQFGQGSAGAAWPCSCSHWLVPKGWARVTEALQSPASCRVPVGCDPHSTCLGPSREKQKLLPSTPSLGHHTVSLLLPFAPKKPVMILAQTQVVAVRCHSRQEGTKGWPMWACFDHAI